MEKAILSIGGNLGNRLENISRTIDYIAQRIGTIIRRSSVYESEAWGFESEDRFLNMVVVVETSLSPETLLQEAHAIEALLLRQRTGTGYASRTMDIDILFFNDEIINTPTLTIPHPRLHERRFVLAPLCEILPDMVHPVFRKSVKEFLAECCDETLCNPL